MIMMRKFNVSDAVLIAHSGVVSENLKNDLVDFTSFDSDLNEAKAQELKNAATEALEVGTHEEYLAASRQHTEKVTAAMQECQTVFSELRYFLKKYFKNQPAFLQQFGLSRFNKVRRKQDELIVFFSTLAKQVSSQREQLVNAGINEPLLDRIAPAGTALKNANDEQDAFLSSQKVDTSKRIKKLNALYSLIMEFSDAAEIVYGSQPEKRTMYAMPQTGVSSDDDELVDTQQEAA